MAHSFRFPLSDPALQHVPHTIIMTILSFCTLVSLRRSSELLLPDASSAPAADSALCGHDEEIAVDNVMSLKLTELWFKRWFALVRRDPVERASATGLLLARGMSSDVGVRQFSCARLLLLLSSTSLAELWPRRSVCECCRPKTSHIGKRNQLMRPEMRGGAKQVLWGSGLARKGLRWNGAFMHAGKHG